ncbi:hypothetical protein [Rhodococcus jostii]|uniref:hypothetical protein n=1 Tax=Rhodococcus jostii TaxID=132919 RepID=UPI003644FF8E
MTAIGYTTITFSKPIRFRISRADDTVVETETIGRIAQVEDQAVRGAVDFLGFILRLEEGEEITLAELMHRWGEEHVGLLDADPWL